MAEIEKDFTLLTVALVEDDTGQQHAVNSAFTSIKPGVHSVRIESLPWGELVGRRITGVSSENGRLVLGLSTKDR